MTTGRVVAAATVWVLFAGTAEAAEVWTRATQPNGAVLYSCAEGDCGRSATLSCRAVPPETVTTIEAFTARIDKQIADLRAVGRELEARPATRTAMGGRVLFRTTLTYAGGASGFESGFLVAPQEAFAVISTANDAKTTKRNFDRFVARLAGRPIGGGTAECPP